VKISRLSAAIRTEWEAGKNYAQGEALGSGRDRGIGRGKRAGRDINVWIGVGEFPELAFSDDSCCGVQAPRMQSELLAVFFSLRIPV